MSDYNFLMESRLSRPQFQVLSQVSRLAAEQGLNLYLTGGAVRDLTYGQQVVRDLDFAVEGNPQKILRSLTPARPRRAGPARASPGSEETASVEVESLQFEGRLQSAGLTFSNGVRAELAMCRNEVYPQPGRRPEISPAAIFEDLKRRDFSVNAMAVSLHPNSRGLLLDPTNGALDIERREMRILHSRSFLEDPTRIYRLLRLSLRLGFKPEERTKQHLNSALENRLWERLDPEQQGRELRAILYEDDSGRVLKMFSRHDLLAGLDRKLARTRILYDRFAKIRSVARSVPGADPFLLYFLCLVEKLGRGQRNRLARKILPDKQTVAVALNIDREAVKLARVLGSSKAGKPGQVYTILSVQRSVLLLYLLVYYPQVKIQKRIKNYLLKYLPMRAKLPRALLQNLGVKPGPQFEKIIERVFFDQLDGKIKTQQQLMKALRAAAGIPEPAPKPAKPAKGAKLPKSARIAKDAKVSKPAQAPIPSKAASRSWAAKKK